MSMTMHTLASWCHALRSIPLLPAERQSSREPIVSLTRAATERIANHSDSALREKVESLRRQATAAPASLSDNAFVANCFSIVNESARTTLDIEYFDVQLVAGHALIQRTIAEMATGEGKTLVQALAAFAFALPGNGVHVMTSNEYLAERDFDQLSPILNRLGLRTGLLRRGDSPAQKRQAYLAEITFGAGCEFGFDFLRDQVVLGNASQRRLGESLRQEMKGNLESGPEIMQRGHAVAIVDEIDSVMIDEATTPLILSAGNEDESTEQAACGTANRVASRLTEGTDFMLDRTKRTVALTTIGVKTVLASHTPPERAHLARPWLEYIEQALFARHLLRRNVDYVVRSEEIQLIDQTTGRVYADRTLRNGLHQAAETKEGLRPSSNQSTLGQISRQGYFHLYDTVCGMTGTASESQREFWTLFRLSITRIPSRKPCQRAVLPTRFFADKNAKRAAIVQQILQRMTTAQPVLVGSRTIDESLALAQLLTAERVPFELLNGVQDRDEAEIVARAGQPHAITIATNLAGRGTDIRLGPGVDQLGGLHVIASEPHASSRVDRQLMGRCARQGDPGSYQLFVAAED